MGLFSWWQRRAAGGDAVVPAAAADGHGRERGGGAADGPGGLSVLSGTTTVAADACRAVFARHEVSPPGHLELEAVLQHEPDNPVDPRAVAVLVEGERVGYLPGPGAAAVGATLATGSARTGWVQLFCEDVPKGLRVEGWVWIGNDPPQWEWSSSRRPPMSPHAKTNARHQLRSDPVRAKLARGGREAWEARSGMVDGVHYLGLVEPIVHLKREGRLEEALQLCYRAIEAAERESVGMVPPPAYTEHAAIIHRKLRQREEEIAVLSRWMAACPLERAEGSRLALRLAKLQQ